MYRETTGKITLWSLYLRDFSTQTAVRKQKYDRGGLARQTLYDMCELGAFVA